MKFAIQAIVALGCLGGTLALMGLLVYSELNHKELNFGLILGGLGLLSFVSFMILTQNNDNEETHPVKDRPKK